MTRFNRVLLAGVALAAMASAPAWAEVKIGLGAPLTGPNAAFGEQLKRGTDAAVKAINDAGGINGEKISVVYGDDASDPRQGVAAANELVGQGVVAVIGHYNSSVSIPASAIYAEEGIVQITPASTNPQLTEQGQKTTFRTCGRDDQQGDVAGAFIAEKFKGRNVAILQDQTTYGKGLADATKSAMNKAGLTEVLYEGITVGERDFSAVVSKMKQAKIDLIYFGGLHNEAGLIVRQAREQGLNAQFISGDGIVTQEFWGITGEAGAGVLMTFPADQRSNPGAKAVVDKFRADKYEPEGYTLLTYAAVQAWAEAATKAKSLEGPKVAEALHDGSKYSTVIGDLSFDAKGDLTKSDYVFYIWNSGTYAEATQGELAKVGAK
ncbi:branched-chain amino acid ABC transporter substrate-binding protein [Inquilinus sp. CA228]|uniref:branched-chain amino acid ABC transporter substrate-binding protein n=1 Tax=Inquilinus sp. CA228 TaxID=3455609 RepID=UPI003F8CF923